MYDQHDVETLERQFNAAMEEADTGSSLEAVRRIYDEIGRGGAGLEALLHPDFQIRMETVFLEGKTYKGVRGFKNWRADMEELFESDSFRPEGLRSVADGRWVVLGPTPDHPEGERRRARRAARPRAGAARPQGRELHGLFGDLGGARVGRAAGLGLAPG